MSTINEGHTSTGGCTRRRFSVDDESGSLWNGSSHEMQIQRLLSIVLELKQDARAYLRVEQSLECALNYLAIVLSIALNLLYVAYFEKISYSEFESLLEIIRVLGVFICTNCCQRHVYWRCLRCLKDRNPQSTPGEDQLSPMRHHETPLLNSGHRDEHGMGFLQMMLDTLAIGLLLLTTVGFVLVLIVVVSVPFAQLGFFVRESPLLWHEIEIDPTYIGHGCDNLVVHYELSEIRQGQQTRRVVAFNHQVAFYLPAITLAVLLGKDLLVAAFGHWCTRTEERETPRCKLLKQFVARFISDQRRGFIATAVLLVVISSMAVSIPAVIQQTECAPWFEFLSLTVFIVSFVISFFWLPISQGLLVGFSFLVSLIVVVLLASFGPAPLEVPPNVGATSESILVHAPGYFQILRKEHDDLLKTSAIVFPCLPFLALWVYRFPVRLFAHYTTRDLLILGGLDNVFQAIHLPFSLTQLNFLPVDSTTKGEVVEFMKRACRNRDMESLSPDLSPIDDLILGEGSVLAQVPEDEKVSHVIGLYYLNALQRKVSSRLARHRIGSGQVST